MQFSVNHLLKDELIFELRCRGASPSDNCTVKELQGMLRKLLELDKQGKSFKSEYNYVVSEELILIDQKLTSVSNYLQESFSHNAIRKIETRLNHIFNRLEHMVSSDQTELKEKSKLLSKALSLAAEFDIKTEDYKKNNTEPCDLAIQNASSSTPIKQTPPATDGDLTLKVLQQLSINESSKIKSWGLSFNGESDNMGLNAFLERVFELAEAHGVSKLQLFKSSVELFDGKALIWFRSIREKVSDWESLCKELRKEFLPHDYNDKLWQQIKARTQGEKESIGIFLAIMNNLFNRLAIEVKEDTKLKTIRKNILPFYQSHLMLTDIQSLDELESLCKKLEQGRDALTNFIPPTCDKSMVEPDLSYRINARKRLDNIEIEKSCVQFNEKNKSRDSSRESNKSSRSRKNKYVVNSTDVNKNIKFDRSVLGTHQKREREFPSYSRDNSIYNRDNSNDRYYNRDNRGHSKERYSGNSIDKSRGYSNDRNRMYSRNREYSRDRNRGNDRYDKNVNSRGDSKVNLNRVQSEIICRRCKAANHFARNCTAKICFNCGKLGYTKLNCPDCNQGNFQGNFS